MSYIDKEKLLKDANTGEALKAVLSNYTWKRNGKGYRAKEHGSYSIYQKGGAWLFASHNGDYTGGNILNVVKDVFNLDLKDKDQFKQACIEICNAANLNINNYITEGREYIPQANQKAKPEPQAKEKFKPNEGQDLSINFAYEIAEKESDYYLKAIEKLKSKTGATMPQNVEILKSITHITAKIQTVFNEKNICFAYKAGQNLTAKYKDTTKENPKKQVWAIENRGNKVFGLDDLPKENRKDFTLLLVGGEDDTLCINHNLHPFNICALTFGSESATIPQDYLKELQGEFKAVLCCFDTDTTGVKMSIRNQKEYGLQYIDLTPLKKVGVKDICDLYGKGKNYLIDAMRTGIYDALLKENALHIKGKAGQYLTDILTAENIPFSPYALNNTLLIAPTGTGKTYLIGKLPFSVVSIAPTKALCRNYLKYGFDIYLGGKEKDSLDVIKYSQKIVTTYANLPNLVKHIDASKYFLCVDESHNFTTSTNKNFMLYDLRKCLELSKQFTGRLFVTGTEIYNFNSELENLKKIVVSIPKAEKQAQIINAKSVIQTAINKAIESIQAGRFPLILLNDKDIHLKQVTEGLSGYNVQVLNSNEKQSTFFESLTKDGVITEGVHGIITTSVIKEGNDILNNLDYDFIICNTGNAIFHSIEIEQFVNRARKPKSVFVQIIKTENRKQDNGIFKPNDCKEFFKKHSEVRANYLNYANKDYLKFECKASLTKDCIIQIDNTFEVCDLLLSNRVFECERQYELSNEDYQRAQLEKYNFIFDTTAIDKTKEGIDIKEIRKEARAEKKAAFQIAFNDAKNEILSILEQGSDIDILTLDTSSEGKAFAVSCFEQLTDIGIHESKVFELIEHENLRNENDLQRTVKSIAFAHLRNDAQYMNDNSLRAIQLKFLDSVITEGEKYTVNQLRTIKRDMLRIEKAYTKNFHTWKAHDILDFIRVFYDIKADSNEKKFYKIQVRKTYNYYYRETISKKGVLNELIINELC